MDKELLAYFIEHQFELPKKLYYYAERFPNVTFNQALKLYELAVKEVIITFNAKHLFDTPLSFGKGLFYAKKEWLRKMENTEKQKIFEF